MIALGSGTHHQHQAGARRRLRGIEGDPRPLSAHATSRCGAAACSRAASAARTTSRWRRCRTSSFPAISRRARATGSATSCAGVDDGRRGHGARAARSCRASASTVDVDRVDDLTVRREELWHAAACARMTTASMQQRVADCSPTRVADRLIALRRDDPRESRAVVPGDSERPTGSTRRSRDFGIDRRSENWKTGVVARVRGRRSPARRSSPCAATSTRCRFRRRRDLPFASTVAGRDARLRARHARDVGGRRRGAARRAAGRRRRARRASAGGGDREGRARDSRERRARRRRGDLRRSRRSALRGWAGRRRRRSARRVGRHVRDRARSAPARTRRGRTSRAIRSWPRRRS